VVSIRSLGAGAIATFYGVDAVALGANNLDIGIIAIAGLVAGGLISLPAGRYIDRRGEIQGIFYGTIVMLGGLVFFSFATNWWYFVPGQVLRWVGFAFLGPGMLAFVARLAPAGRRAEYLGTFSLINSTLWSLGPFAGALALSLGGAPALFAVAFGTTFISVAAIEGVYRRPGRRQGTVEGAPHIANGP
jgi:MFS family permease